LNRGRKKGTGKFVRTVRKNGKSTRPGEKEVLLGEYIYGKMVQGVEKKSLLIWKCI